MNIIPARYTEVLVNLINNPEAKAKIDQAMSTYPLYQKKSTEEYMPSYIPTREELNNAILNYYKYREIGFETFGRFLEELKTALEEIMPYYNQLFFSTDQDYDLLYNVDYTRDITREKQNTGNSETTTEASDTATTTSSLNNYSKNVNSQTPQGNLNITAQGINNVTYADNVSWNHNTGNDSATSTGTANTTANGTTENNEDETTKERVKGNYGQMSYQTLLGQYRDLIINVTQQIINDERISELFMLVY